MKILRQSNMKWSDLGTEYQFMYHPHRLLRLLKDSKPGFSTRRVTVELDVGDKKYHHINLVLIPDSN